jgi:hypothetical protein
MTPPSLSVEEIKALEALPMLELTKRLDQYHLKQDWLICSSICSILSKKGAMLGLDYMRKAMKDVRDARDLDSE